MRLAIVFLLLGVCAIGCNKARKEGCRDLSFRADVYHFPLTAAPRQSDFSPEAQRENWQWRSELVEKEAAALEAVRYGDSDLDALKASVIRYYHEYASAAAKVSEAWRTRDPQVSRLAEIADVLQDTPDQLKRQIAAVCSK